MVHVRTRVLYTTRIAVYMYVYGTHGSYSVHAIPVLLYSMIVGFIEPPPTAPRRRPPLASRRWLQSPMQPRAISTHQHSTGSYTYSTSTVFTETAGSRQAAGGNPFHFQGLFWHRLGTVSIASRVIGRVPLSISIFLFNIGHSMHSPKGKRG